MTDAKKDCFVSLILPACREIEVSRDYIIQAHSILDRTYTDFEILLVCAENSEQSIVDIEKLLSEKTNIRILEMYGEPDIETMYGAGLESAIGDISVLMNSQFDNPEIIVPAIELALEGFDVVVGVYPYGRNFVYRTIRKIFRAVATKTMQYHIPKNSTDFRVLNRSTVNAVTRHGKFRSRLFYNISLVTRNTTAYEYQISSLKTPRASFYSVLRKSFSFMVFNTTKPLRWASAMGVLASFSALLISFYALIIKLVKNQVVEGWTSLTIFISIFFCLLFVILVFLGEYMYRLLEEYGKSAEYYIRSEKHSSVMVDELRRNVLTDMQKHSLEKIQTGRDR